ncbi:extracellular solute-binding protein [Bosea sp. ANAM02]|uniref:ABC transporter substrate-binding protein n=1 Tax=Bosea sp. ANAM02 TaxID=2020412 RepID=UPI0015646C79|nr:extracellular solute-binding protein [Bosea sp. ANAM02]
MNISRRNVLIGGAGLAAGATLPFTSSIAQAKIEQGASLRVLRPTKFVDPDQAIFNENTEAFTKATGVQVKVDYAGWEDLRPQTAVTANTGAGPDIVVGWADDPHIFSDKLIDLTPIAEELGKKYGGWYPIAEKYGKKDKTNQWISIPMGASGAPAVYRESWVKEAGFDTFPKDLDGFLKLCRKLKEIGHPAGFALGNAVGDGNAFCNWLVWTHGGYMVDENNKVAINSKETIEALKYAKALYETFIPGTLSWLDISNNKALSAGEVGLTQNGVSLYFSIKNSKDEKTAAIGKDLNHATMPVGPLGRPSEPALIINAMAFKHTKYPNAAKEYLRFMMEKEQYDKWLTGCYGYWAQPLKGYAESKVWQADPKIVVYRDTWDRALWSGYKGAINEAAGTVNAEYVVVQMVASVCAGQATPEEAAKEAERRAKRYYRT